MGKRLLKSLLTVTVGAKALLHHRKQMYTQKRCYIDNLMHECELLRLNRWTCELVGAVSISDEGC